MSLFGFDPQFDYEALTRQARQRRIFVSAPDQSLVLRKALNQVPHGGGKRFEAGSAQHRVLRDWIRGGARPPDDFDLHVTRIEVTPSDLVFTERKPARLEVRAHWSDGATEDVTDHALYEVRHETCADVSPQGKVEPNGTGRTAVTVTFGGQAAAVTVTVPYGELGEPIDFAANNYIDRLVAAEWEKVGLRPAELCDDHEFLRRLHLDVIGTLPTPQEIEEFTASTDPDKRSKRIDALLERPEYVDYWASHWADLLRVHRRYVGEKGMWAFWNWVRTAVRENWPVDRLARELLTSRGSLFANGATAYYFVDEDPAQLAETTSQLFLGVRLQCAKCHHHPYEVWSQQDYYGLASFFTRLEVKDNGDGARYGGTRLLRPIGKVNRDRRLKMAAEPTLFGQAVDPAKTDDVRKELAEWITAQDNPYFTRNFVNRYWSYLMGRGLVEPVDDLRATNPPTHPELFEALNEDFVAHGNDVKHLIRTICKSRVYQLASRPTSERDREGVFYAHRRYRRLPAAVMLDAVNFATGTSENFRGLPRGTRAISLPDPTIPSYFLDTFGRSSRANPCECAISNDPDLAQALHMVNSTAVNDKVADDGGRVAKLLKSTKPDAEVVKELFLVTWSRPPTDEERDAALRFVTEAPTRKEGLQDLLWTLLNSTEFVFQH